MNAYGYVDELIERKARLLRFRLGCARINLSHVRALRTMMTRRSFEMSLDRRAAMRFSRFLCNRAERIAVSLGLPDDLVTAVRQGWLLS